MKRDPVEDTKEYKEAMEQIQPILDKEFPENKWGMGICYAIWERKRELLLEKGIEWRSPAIMNPGIMFD